jgi:hypothetical protein
MKLFMEDIMTLSLVNKKTMLFVVLFCIGIFGTVAHVNAQSNDMPPWINEMPPDDEIWGIGLAKLVNSKESKNWAELQARSAIVSQLYTAMAMVRNDDDEFNNLYVIFMMYINLEASFEIIDDTKVLKTWVAPDGTSWCLITMHKSNARKYISIFENIYQRYYGEVFPK